MTSLEKVSIYLDSFNADDANYDFACYIKQKLAELPFEGKQNVESIHEEENNNALEVETSEFDKSREDYEGELMEPAFKDLDALNQIEEEKQKIKSAEAIKNFLAKIRRN